MDTEAIGIGIGVALFGICIIGTGFYVCVWRNNR